MKTCAAWGLAQLLCINGHRNDPEKFHWHSGKALRSATDYPDRV
jgi:hypothetical protein